MKINDAIEQYGQALDARKDFYVIARQAVDDGLITAAERDTICRPHTRKAGYWARHLVDLRAVLAERRTKLGA